MESILIQYQNKIYDGSYPYHILVSNKKSIEITHETDNKLDMILFNLYVPVELRQIILDYYGREYQSVELEIYKELYKSNTFQDCIVNFKRRKLHNNSFTCVINDHGISVVKNSIDGTNKQIILYPKLIYSIFELFYLKRKKWNI